MSVNFNKALHAEHQHQTGNQPTDARAHGRPMLSSHGGFLTTDAMAEAVGVRAQSVRKRYSQTGTYFGLRPVKLPSRRLMWDANAVIKFLTRDEG